MNNLICNINFTDFFSIYIIALQMLQYFSRKSKIILFYIIYLSQGLFFSYVLIQYQQFTLIVSLHSILNLQVNMHQSPDPLLRWSNEICFSLNVHANNCYTIKGKFQDVDGKCQGGYQQYLNHPCSFIEANIRRKTIKGNKDSTAA